MKKLSDLITEQLSEPLFIERLGGGFKPLSAKNDSLDKKLNDIHFNRHISFEIDQQPTINQQNIVDITLKTDVNMDNFLRVLDIINGFDSFTKLYIKDRQSKNKEIGWYVKEIQKSITSVNYYVEQFAHNINPYAKNEPVQINFESNGLDNNINLDTHIRKSEEWKDLKKLMKKDFITFDNQPLSIRALCVVIIKKIQKFMNIMK